MTKGVIVQSTMEGIRNINSLNLEKGFKLVHWNVRSLVKKIDQIRALMDGSPIDVLTLSETWLKHYLHSDLVAIEGFDTFRSDRGPNMNRCLKVPKRGGGLITYVSKKYSSHCEPLLDLGISNENIEAQWTLVHRPNCKNVLICNVYRPPNGNLDKAVKYLWECLCTLNLNKLNLFIMGDLNINYKNKSAGSYKKLHFFIQSHGLSQHINTTTRNTDKTKSLIDLAITNSKYVCKSGTLDHYVSDHQPIYIVHKKGRDVRQSVKFEGRSYRSFNHDAFRDALRGLDWEGFYELTDPNLAWAFVLSSITPILDDMCPLRSFYVKNYRPDWITNELLEQIKDRDYFYCKAKKSGDLDAWNIAKHLRNTTNVNIRRAKREYILGELEANANDCKKFWKTIRGVIHSDKQQARQDILLKDKEKKLGKEEVAGFINSYFINVGRMDKPDVSDVKVRGTGLPDGDESNKNTAGADNADCPKLDKFTKLCEMEVYRIVKDINISKSSGLENVSSFIVKEAFLSVLPEITHMFNLSLTTSVFPTDWKKALIVPIPKTGDLTQVKNFRPISLLPLPGKILEKLAHLQITSHLEINSLLTDSQHGFRKGRSTIHSVAQLTNYINAKMDVGLPTLATFLDFRKAFDCVQHQTLLDKLEMLNIGADIIDWVKSYLTSRVQRVYANGTYSSYKTILQGVPQGSVLGPLFYIVYANDLVNVVKYCKVALYADDTVLYTAAGNFGQSVTAMQKDINSIAKWCMQNGISANVDKSKVMVLGTNNSLKYLPPYEIKFGDFLLSSVNSYKYLGVTVDCHLNYNLHVNKIVASVSSKLKQFQRMRSFLTIKAALLVYKSMMLPVLEYGDLFLSAATVKNRRRLQVLQNKGLRCALNRGSDTTTDELHADANLLKLKYRRELHTLNFMYGASSCPNSLVSRGEDVAVTRSCRKKTLKVKRPKTEKFKKSLAYLGPHKWNALPLDLHQATDRWEYKRLARNWVNQKALAAQSATMIEA